APKDGFTAGFKMPTHPHPNLWHYSPMTTPTILTVTQLNHSVRDLLEFNYGRVWLRGEISNMSAPSSGHLYFTLKDDQAQVRAAMFKGARLAARLQAPPRNGQQVIIRAKVSLYAPRGDYQLIVEHLEDAGVGALQQAFEQLKAKLAAEGLFAAERKRELPANPRGIAVVTSPSGAAIRDILQVLARRAPSLPVTVFPVPVQGVEAVPALLNALQHINQLWQNQFIDAAGAQHAPFDVVLLARGGGSLEDLWAFNDEALARLITTMPLPVVSGVGHEIDFTICDFVADLRAPTPSAAAELVSTDQAQWRGQMVMLLERLTSAMRRQQLRQRQQLLQWAQRLRGPQRLLQEQQQRLDDISLRLNNVMQRTLRQRRERFAPWQARLMSRDPARQLQKLSTQVQQLSTRLNSAMQRRLTLSRQQLTHLVQQAQAVSPMGVIARGYAIVSHADSGDLIRSVNASPPGSVVNIQLIDGHLRATVLTKDV
ncbi:MAG: exodeoxyribonuclease VII large subunit, partial [Moraxellaceae bacterium]|nr:exodeoxyribonuclease VII large subunit [Moraxellaceae bacterium]